MTLNLNLNFAHPVTVVLKSEMPPELAAELAQLKTILMKQSEALAALAAASTQLREASEEILAKLAELGSTDPDISPEGQAIIDGITAKAKALADIVPNVPPPAPEP